MEKVLLVYSSKPPIMQYLASAFNRKGISTEMVYADANHWFDRYIIHSANKLLHNLRIIPKDKSVFSNHPLTHINYRSSNLWKIYKQFNPDMVLLIRGIGFRHNVLEDIRKSTPLFCWWIEKEERIEEALKEINLFDWYFFMNSSCIEEGLKRGHSNVSLLHHSVDPLVWHPVDVEKKYDWSFVGSWSAKRQEVIERAVKVSVNAALYGPRWGKRCRFNSPIRRI
ncbi:MAG: hypothetical protein QMD07_05820, partial [Thermodesulfovibrionales bacterium]|nr:hypothetical protein [Thermodesulfovibrionales bacterium]